MRGRNARAETTTPDPADPLAELDDSATPRVPSWRSVAPKSPVFGTKIAAELEGTAAEADERQQQQQHEPSSQSAQGKQEGLREEVPKPKNAGTAAGQGEELEGERNSDTEQLFHALQDVTQQHQAQQSQQQAAQGVQECAPAEPRPLRRQAPSAVATVLDQIIESVDKIVSGRKLCAEGHAASAAAPADNANANAMDAPQHALAGPPATPGKARTLGEEVVQTCAPVPATREPKEVHAPMKGWSATTTATLISKFLAQTVELTTVRPLPGS